MSNEFDEDEESGFSDDDIIESVVVIDEEGNELEFYILDVLDHKGITYLLVVDDIEDEEETEATIVKEVEMDGDEIIYALIEDEEEFNIVAELFENNNDDYDIEV